MLWKQYPKYHKTFEKRRQDSKKNNALWIEFKNPYETKQFLKELVKRN